jgi:hypothetical protein
MYNARRNSTGNPWMLVLMIDQSVSMGQPCSNLSESKAVVAAKILNQLIDSIIQKNYSGDHAKDRCFIVAIGYSVGAAELCSGFLSDLDNSPRRMETVKKKISDGTGGLVEFDITISTWVKPISDEHEPNMVDAFKLAESKIKDWVTRFPYSPAPIIINISSGVLSSNEQRFQVKVAEVEDITNRVKSIQTHDGNTLIYNIAMLDTDQEIAFPTKNEIKSFRQVNLRFLSDISSEIPQEYEYLSQRIGVELDCPAKGIVSVNNAHELLNISCGY